MRRDGSLAARLSSGWQLRSINLAMLVTDAVAVAVGQMRGGCN